MERKFDLLGDPIPENFGKPGANGHTPTAENIKKVRGLLAAGMGKAEIAKELGISAPTLSKHYFQNGRLSLKAAKKKAQAEQRAKVMLRLEEAVDKGNVAAMKEMCRIIDAEERADLASELAKGGSSPKKVEKPLPKGKKEELQAQADQAWDDPLFSGRPN